MRNPNDEQLRLLCAGSIYNHELENISCVEILEDPEIAKDTALSIRIIDAAIQWRQAVNIESSEKYDDNKLAKEFMTKNFSPKVMVFSMPNSEDFDISKHPSYERGAHLLKKFEQNIKDCTTNPMTEARETMGYLRDIDKGILQGAFEHSPHFTKAYTNVVQSYKDAYLRQAVEDLDYSPAYTTYETIMSKKVPGNTMSSGRTDY